MLVICVNLLELMSKATIKFYSLKNDKTFTFTQKLRLISFSWEISLGKLYMQILMNYTVAVSKY